MSMCRSALGGCGLATTAPPTTGCPATRTPPTVINVLHLLLPAGERWFGQVYRKALPLIDDPDLARDVKAFIGQEATHARKHRSVAFDAYEAMGGG